MYVVEVRERTPTKIQRLDLPVDLEPTDPAYKRLVAWDRMVEVLVDPSAPGYQQFVGWNDARALPVKLDDLPPGRVFFGAAPLVAFCKQHGIMLHALPGKGFTAQERWARARADELVRLCEAWAFDPSSGEPEAPSGIVPRPTDCWMPTAVWRDLTRSLEEEDQDVRRISSWPLERTLVYLDVSDFSKYKPGQEALIINSLVRLVQHDAYWPVGGASRLNRLHEAMMCIGDGYIFVFQEPMVGAYFAAYLAQLIEALVAKRALPVEFHFRMGVHVGAVYSFWDPGRRDWNYIGDGINGGHRVLTAIDNGYDDQVFISGEVRQALMASPSRYLYTSALLANLHNRGRRLDKHGRPWRVYEVGHTALCAKELPPDVRE
jgi:class 3 adenylate cyclase